MLIVEDISVKKGETRILENISFELNEYENIAILGHSGSGKSTLLRALSGLEIPSQGKITFNNNVLFQQSNNSSSVNISPQNRNIGFVFQDLALFPHLSVQENVAFGLRKNWNAVDKQARVQELLQNVELLAYEKRYPHELSGGQKQRVALARSLAPKPKLVLLDEPFSSLDETLRNRLCLYTKSVLKAQKTPAILVTHNVDEALYFGSKILVMNSGKVAQFGTIEEVLNQPSSSFVATFVSGYLPCFLLSNSNMSQKKKSFFHPKFFTSWSENAPAKSSDLIFKLKILEFWKNQNGLNFHFDCESISCENKEVTNDGSLASFILSSFNASSLLGDISTQTSDHSGVLYAQYSRENLLEFCEHQ